MKRDHYIIPICSISTSILDAICYLTQLTKFALHFVVVGFLFFSTEKECQMSIFKNILRGMAGHRLLGF